MQPTKINDGISKNDDKSHAVRGGYKLGFEFHNLSIDQDFGLLE